MKKQENRKMKVYIAAPFFNPRQLEIVETIEKELTKKKIDFFSPRSQGKSLKDMDKNEVLKTKKEVFDSNITEMDLCSHCIACVEEKDTGTSFEIGYFYSEKKPITLFSEKIDRINVMLAEAAYSVCDDSAMIMESIVGFYNVELDKLT